MTSIALADAAMQLADLVERARAGEEVVLSKEGRPQVRLEPIKEEIDPSSPEMVEQRRRAFERLAEFRRSLRPDQLATHEELVADKNYGRR